MKGVYHAQKEAVETGMHAATERLVGISQSPLLMGGTIGLVYFLDGPEQGFNFVSDFRYSPEHDQEGFPKELWLAFADYLENIVGKIRTGQLDSFCVPYVDQQVDGRA